MAADPANTGRMKPPHKPIRNLHDLTKVWRFVDGGHGYSAPQLFALLIDSDGLVVPGIFQIYDDESPIAVGCGHCTKSWRRRRSRPARCSLRRIDRWGSYRRTI